MSIIKTFEGNNLSIVKEGDNILFKGKDVALALGYTDTDQAIRKHVDEDEKLSRRFDGVRFCMYINEAGVYSLIFSSKLPKAKEFKKWVFNDVLPSIRKTGQYKTKQNQLSLITENDLHFKVVEEIRKRWPNILLVVPLGEFQDTKEKRLEAWKKGFKGGMPDLKITNLHKEFRGFCIEFKNPGGTGVLSEKQKETLERYKSEGWKTLVTSDLVDCLFEIQEYVKGFMKKCLECGNLIRLNTLVNILYKILYKMNEDLFNICNNC